MDQYLSFSQRTKCPTAAASPMFKLTLLVSLCLRDACDEPTTVVVGAMEDFSAGLGGGAAAALAVSVLKMAKDEESCVGDAHPPLLVCVCVCVVCTRNRVVASRAERGRR